MSDAENSTGPNGGPHSLGDHGREIYTDAQALTSAVRSATHDLERYLTEQVNRRPYTTLGVAVGVGYVLGGGLRSRLTGVLRGVATRVAVALVARELAARILPETLPDPHS